MSLCTVTGGVTSEGIPVRTLLILVALCTANACYLPYDVCHHVSIAPSARPLAGAIFMAIDRLNSKVPDQPWTADFVDSEEWRDGEVVIRLDPGLKSRTGSIGWTHNTARGVMTLLMPTVHERDIAHELGHAAGLAHVDDEENLMYAWSDGGWGLTDEQISALQ